MPQTRTAQEAATPAAAILFVLASGVFFTCLDTSSKYLVLSGMPAPFVAWVRLAVHAVLVFVLFRAWSNPGVFKTASLGMQVLRGLCLFGSTIFTVLALRNLQLAENSAIAFSAPMLITALAGPLLGEWAGWRRWTAIMVGFVGVLIIIRPGFDSFHIGHVFALCSTLSYCIYVILTRRMSVNETPASLIFYSAFAPAMMMLPTVPFTAAPPPGVLGAVLLLCLGIFGGLGHWFVIRAYTLATTTALAPYPYLQMVWMTASGYFVFNQLPDHWTLIGAAVIIGSGLYLIHREHRLRKLAKRIQSNNDPDGGDA